MRAPADASDAATRPAIAVQRCIPWLFGALFVAALFLLREPYRGIRHDAVLYVGQALMHLDPSWTSRDFYFAYGSQDQFTLFSRALAFLVSAVGLSASQFIVLALGYVVSAFALYRLLDGQPPLLRWLALAGAACVPHFYGGRAFSVFEPFATARTLAEPLALLALTALLENRKAWAVVALAACAAMHPLVAIPTAIVMWIMLVLQDRRWLWAAALAVPIVALGAAGVVPFSRLLARYDDDWFPVVAIINALVYVSEWEIETWTVTLFELAILAVAVRRMSTPLAQVGRAALIAAIGACVVSFFAADLFHDVLLTQLQLWRVLWLSHLAMILCLPVLVLDEWRKGGMGRLAAIALLCAVSAVETATLYGWALALWCGLALVLSARNVKVSAGVLKLAIAATLAAAVGTSALTGWSLVYQVAQHDRGLALSHLWSVPFALPLITLPFAALMLWAWGRAGTWRIAAGALAAVMFLGALAQYDQRTAWTRYIESPQAQANPLRQRIPKEAVVFWENGDLAPIWLMLRRASFAGGGQFSGVLFNRETAMASRERAEMKIPLNRLQTKCDFLEGMTQANYRFQDCELPEAEFFRFCTNASAHADYLVTSLPYTRTPLATWRFDPKDGSEPTTWYLHDCKSVR
jgi:hypothetical protein